EPDFLPTMPACYAEIRRRDPSATLLEAPHFGYGGAQMLAGACTYWQSIHRLKTSAGYSGNANVVGNNLTNFTCPLSAVWVHNPHYLDDPDSAWIDLNRGVGFRDATWLFMTVHDFRYLILHRWPEALADCPLDWSR